MSQNVAECWVGVDWGDTEHHVCVKSAEGRVLSCFKVSQSEEGLEELVARLRSFGCVRGVAVETPHGLLIQKLLEAGLPVYPINPKLSKAWRSGESVSEAKSDPTDSESLAEGLRQRHDKLRRLEPDDPLTRELAILCRDECELIGRRTELVNRLTSTLKLYNPQARQWFNDWTAPTAWQFLLSFPTPEALRRAGRQKLIGFLKTHHIGLSPIWRERVDHHGEPSRWPSDEATVRAKSRLAIALAKELLTLQASLNQYRQDIEELFPQHPDAELFRSLPRSGKKLAPRLLSCFGSNRDRFDSVEGPLALSGSVPLTQRSGQRIAIHFRWACQKDFRNAITLYALQTINQVAWARTCYDQCRQRGLDHYRALRQLASKWIKIIFRMWKDRRPYDERLFLTSLARHGSPIIQHSNS